MEKETNSMDKINVVGDRVLVKPRKESERSESGLYLPPGVREKETFKYGYIVKSGPGYPIPLPVDDDEPWKSEDEKVKYVPLQVKEGEGCQVQEQLVQAAEAVHPQQPQHQVRE